MEELSMMLLTVPIFFPLVQGLGFDPVWFGILIVCVIEISLITPPVGMNVFVLSSVLPDVPTGQIWKAYAVHLRGPRPPRDPDRVSDRDALVAKNAGAVERTQNRVVSSADRVALALFTEL